MQTCEQLLSKVLDLIEEAKNRGEKPDVVFLTPNDERTLKVRAWLCAQDDDKSDAIRKAPPNVRSGHHGYSTLAGLRIEWDADKTEVRARTPEELKAYQEKARKGMAMMREANQRLEQKAIAIRNRPLG